MENSANDILREELAQAIKAYEAAHPMHCVDVVVSVANLVTCSSMLSIDYRRLLTAW